MTYFSVTRKKPKQINPGNETR